MPGDLNLTLIVPGLVQPGQVPQLAQLAARGRLRYAWDRHDLAQGSHTVWQRGLLWALQLEAAAHPSAALSALAHGLDPHDALGDRWLHLDTVHLAAGLNHLSLVELDGELALTQAQRVALEPPLRQHLEQAGMRLQMLPNGSWLLYGGADLQLRTVCPAAAAANPLEAAMPQGPHSAQLKRLMTELQMLMHQHPVNLERTCQGVPQANAFWVWGNGRPTRAAARVLPWAFGAHDYLRGLYRLYDNRVQAAPASGEQLLEHLSDAVGDRVLVVLDAGVSTQFEQLWLVPLVTALRARHLRCLELIFDGWHLSIDRRALRRFWRRPLPPGSWVA